MANNAASMRVLHELSCRSTRSVTALFFVAVHRFRTAASVMLVFFVSMCATVPSQEKRIPRLEELSLDEKIGQMFSVGARGVFMGESSAAYQQLLHHLRDNHVGGFIWFVSNVYETALLNDKLQHAARVTLLISADLEAGMGMRFADTTFWPSAMAVAATGDPTLAEQEGRVVAREARALGVNHILAPVADVNVEPDNPVINTRSFGEDPTDVSRYVAAFTRGVQSERVIACAKHFPGHGDTHVDSHRTLPVLDVTRERLERVELVPFRAAIAANVESMMMGHLSVAALDPTPVPLRTLAPGENPYGTTPQEMTRNGTMPATISRPIIDSKEHRDVAGEIARRALTLVREQSGVLPLRPDVNAAVVFVSDFPEAVTPLADFEREVRRRLKNTPQVALIDSRSGGGDIASIGLNADVIILALAVRARSGAGQIAVPPAVRQLVEALGSKPIVAISFGTPYLLRDIPTVGTYICAYGIQPVMQVAAISAIFGETAFSGRLPVTIPGLYPRGHGLR